MGRSIVSHTASAHNAFCAFSVATALIGKYRDAYTLAQNKDKKVISARIVSIITESGRFLKKNEKDGWAIVQSEAARVKVAHALQYRRRRSRMSQEAAESHKKEDALDSVQHAEENSSLFSSERQAETPEAWQIPNSVQSGIEDERILETESLPDQYLQVDEWLQAASAKEQEVETSAWTSVQFAWVNDLLTDAQVSVQNEEKESSDSSSEHQAETDALVARMNTTTTTPKSRTEDDAWQQATRSISRYQDDLQEGGWFQSAYGEQRVEPSACTLPVESASDVDFAAPAAHHQCDIIDHSDSTIREIFPCVNTDAVMFDQIVRDVPTASMPSVSMDASCSSIADAQLWGML